MARHLEPEQAKLYELIWTRTIACQMESAELERTTVEILAEAGARKLEFRATGQVVRFPGFLALYQEGRDDEEDEDSAKLPPMNAGEPLTKERIDATQHFTEPPPRYTEATLVKRMEELGIGRPSTYASTLAVLRDRDYVKLEKKRLIPEDKGRLVTAFLESFFARYVEYDFTAALEEKLDLVSNSEIDWKDVLLDFWRDFSAALGEIKDLRTRQVLDSLNELLGPAYFPAARGRRRRAPLPVLREGAAFAETRQVRRLHRLLQLSRVPLHPRAFSRGRMGRTSPRATGPASKFWARTRRPAKKSPCAMAVTATISSRAKATSPSARRWPRA